ncbi:MAG: YhbY family RNA-binding protein [Clostridia bacterium]|nr:YhbY family RNA-binding protein [Clostridia bacterium]
MTGKERAEKRAEANALEPLFHIGKEGVTDAVLRQLEEAYNTRELLKIKVHLETSPVTPREAADALAAASGSDVIQVIGGVIVLYRYNKKLHEKKTPPAPAKKKTSREEPVRTRRVTWGREAAKRGGLSSGARKAQSAGKKKKEDA